jgi:DNA-binding transcriptional ArsR family regulator
MDTRENHRPRGPEPAGAGSAGRRSAIVVGDGWVHTGAEVTGVKEAGDQVSVTYRTAQGPRQAAAELLVAADGIHSTAPRLLWPEGTAAPAEDACVVLVLCYAYTCKIFLTRDRNLMTEGRRPTGDDLVVMLAALANPLRLRIVARLAAGRDYVSHLAREIGVSRPLLHLHLQRLEAAGLIVGTLELSEDGKAMRYYEVTDFDLHLTAAALAEAAKTLTGSDPEKGPAPKEDS